MAGTTLALWIVTALVGAYLWSFTTDVDRPESGRPATDLPSWLLFVHPLTVGAGLVVWIGFVLSGEGWAASLAFGLLVAAALLGDVLLLRTVRGRTPRPRAEDRIPRPAIALHGALAGATLVLALLTALGVG